MSQEIVSAGRKHINQWKFAMLRIHIYLYQYLCISKHINLYGLSVLSPCHDSAHGGGRHKQLWGRQPLYYIFHTGSLGEMHQSHQHKDLRIWWGREVFKFYGPWKPEVGGDTNLISKFCLAYIEHIKLSNKNVKFRFRKHTTKCLY